MQADPYAAPASSPDPLEQAELSLERLRISYYQTPEDLGEWSVEHVRRKSAGARSWLRWAPWLALTLVATATIMLGLSALLERIAGEGDPDALPPFALLAIATAGFAFLLSRRKIYFFQIRRQARAMYSREDGVLVGRCERIVTREGLRSATQFLQGDVAWPAVTDFWTGKEALYVVLGNGAGLIFPRRCFASEAEFENALEQMRAWRKAALETPSKSFLSGADD